MSASCAAPSPRSSELAWEVTYWRDGDAVTVADAVDPDGVLWVDVLRDDYRMRLVGHDRYWLAGDEFGCWNDDDSATPGDGMAFRWPPGENPDPIGCPLPPPDAHVWHGVQIPDDDARRVGLL